MTSCDFQSLRTGQLYCIRCGLMSPVVGANVFRECVAASCRHLAEPSLFRSGPQAGQPVTIEVTCDTCGGGRTQQRQAVYKCEKLGRCLPHYRPSDVVLAEYKQRPDKIALCPGCPHFTPPA